MQSLQRINVTDQLYCELHYMIELRKGNIHITKVFDHAICSNVLSSGSSNTIYHTTSLYMYMPIF